jgi:hypothetical protein
MALFNALITSVLQIEDFVAWKSLWFALNRSNAFHATGKEQKQSGWIPALQTALPRMACGRNGVDRDPERGDFRRRPGSD